ncbi:protein of unknown function (plasmid) [Cupriavidus taiwanensis]|uniref:Uncharacterized protein n=1 Tax=Cupriavidus taiwanensis TaxID=164546 RepID=A0A375INV4_9BURK|nr:protein of unknown function [Cupriavidus taiwanensis]
MHECLGQRLCKQLGLELASKQPKKTVKC